MKLYSFYTASHKELLNKWFLPSLKDDFELILEEYLQECPTGRYMQKGWIDCMKNKVALIIRAIEENPNQIFIHSDVDIQFFRPIKATIERLMKGKDMLAQGESHRGTVCPGFLVAVGNQKNLKLWQDIKHDLEKQTKKHDQALLNERLMQGAPEFLQRIARLITPSYRAWIPNAYGLKWNYLPYTFYSPGVFEKKNWEPGVKLAVPAGIVLHHANWIVGIENKIAQLQYVRDIVSSREKAYKESVKSKREADL